MIQIRNYIIGILILTGFVIGGIAILGILSTDNPSLTSSDDYTEFNTTFNKYNQLKNNIEGIQSSIEQTEQNDMGTFGVLNNLIMGAWITLKNIFASFSFMDSFFNGLSTMFGVPRWIPSIIILVIITVLAFSIYISIFKST